MAFELPDDPQDTTQTDQPVQAPEVSAPTVPPTGMAGIQMLAPPPVLSPGEMGVPLLPPPPVPPAIPPSPLQSPHQKALTLGAIAAMLAGGQHLSGLGAGVLAGQQQLEQNRLRDAALADQVYQRALIQHDLASRQANQIAEQRSRQLEGYVGQIQKQAAAATTPEEYQRVVGMGVNVLNGVGFHVTPQQVSAWAGPYLDPNAPTIVQRALSKWENDKNAQQFLKDHPDQLEKATIDIPANTKGVPTRLTIPQAYAYLGLHLALNADGTLLKMPLLQKTNPEYAQQSALNKFLVETNGRPPQTKADFDHLDQLTHDALETVTEKPTKEPTPHFTVTQTFDAEGKPAGVVKVNTLTGEVSPVRMPGGTGPQLKPPPSAAKPLSFQAASQVGSLNTAEVEGVKVLRALHESGLDTSNDPLDPRWNKFVVTTLKIAPNDFNKADIQQRTAFINAALTRQLMGGRPSQYIAQMIQQHMPQGEMSGQQLTHVLTNVLQQAGEQRAELKNMMPGVKEPASGQSYADYLSEIQQKAGATIKVGKYEVTVVK